MQEPLRTLVVEDEQDSQELMQTLINDYCPELSIIGMASDVAEAIDKITKLRPEVVLLDISLGHENSFDIISELETKNFIIVFTTAHENYALKAFENDAVFYLLKPYSISGIRKMVEKIIDAQILDKIKRNKNNYFSIQNQGETVFIELDSIVMFEAERSYSKVYLDNGLTYVISKSLAKITKELDELLFLRVHHSYLVNISKIVKVFKEKNYSILLKDKSIIPVSRNKKEEINLLIKNK